jgi:uncharacterized membrane protein YeaQ/YmgE (transglycosylase-associated protein family)
MLHLLGQAIFGLCVGIIAKLLVPGKDPGGLLVTALLGLAGSLVGTGVGRLFRGQDYKAHWIMSIIGAILLLVLYRMFT